MSYTLEFDSDDYIPVYHNEFTITGSIKAHPKLWFCGACIWVLSCVLVWKLMLIALERASRPKTSRRMWTTGKRMKSI
ncbi:hypothetical protein P171DRAFT_426612 [Karstenula rhodostoma CBS 690.94]|uniref:Uncharacterized protein n=1 Tax=Karstenula rhodostoma CBS 690.94 TaxID=1392251 RepID=A0A9P4PTI7_9PLEO|nr:hypothetical protein P171DRAFT_426612 [Karstenula rhodostoma CBS 690.94]